MKEEMLFMKTMDHYRVKPEAKVDLSRIRADDTACFKGHKAEAAKTEALLQERLDSLQDMLYIDGRHKVLIVLQGMDTAGKDGTIRKIFSGVNPQGVSVKCFKQPTPEELQHDFLWRVHQHAPASGRMTIFNRSHYEDVLVVRVHNLVPAETWRQRYDHIKAFEKMLAEEGTIILKFFLHIDPKEQLARIRKRLDKKEKHWKLSEADLAERKLWPEYTAAYEEALGKTSTDWAPWYVVPANKKWYRDLIISGIIVQTLEKLHLQYPKINLDLAKLRKGLQ